METTNDSARRDFLKKTALSALPLFWPESRLPSPLSTSLSDKKNPTILLRSSWNDRNIGDIGLPEWRFESEQVIEKKLINVLMAIQKDYPLTKNKVEKAMDYVALRQKATMETVTKVSLKA